MSQTVSINQFEGPLALLLELVERNKLPVTEITVATITGQYLERIAELDTLPAEELAEFLQLGSRLVYVKSLALLPTSQPDEATDELAELTRELAEYQRYQAAAKTLARLAARPTWPRHAPAKLPSHELPLPNVGITQLAAAFQAALKRIEPTQASRAVAAELSQADILSQLEHRLSRGSFALAELLANLQSRLEIVVTFSALLELIRTGRASVGQSHQFADLIVEAA